MIKKLLNLAISTRTTAVLLVVYAVAMASATFVENDFGTPTAKAFIYNAKWFEMIMLLLILNFIGNIYRYRLLRKEKWPVLVFHLSFVFIFVGAAVTRYVGFEGMMHIREGESSGEIISDKQFFKVAIEENGEIKSYKDIHYLMSPSHHKLEARYEFEGKNVKVKAVDYILHKKDSLFSDEKGKEYLHIVSSGKGGRINIYLASGEVKSLNGMLISYNRPIEKAIEFKSDKGILTIKSPEDGEYLTMATQREGSIKKDVEQELVLRSLYRIGSLSLVVPTGLEKGNLLEIEGDRQKDSALPDLLKVEITGPRSKQLVNIPVEKGNANMAKQVSIDGMNVMLGFGPRIYYTPFALRLDKFVMETYPGSSSPSSFESHVSIIDKGKESPERIYMNNVLDYEGYRFFQSGFDPDMRGTILSVNHDYWGTLISYTGYFFLFCGLFASLFWKGSRFWELSERLKSLSKNKTMTLLLTLLCFSNVMAQDPASHREKPSANGPGARVITRTEMSSSIKIDKKHAERFGYLLVQSFDGRIAPINTTALEVLRKLYKHDSFENLTANQWFLSISMDPYVWAHVPFIKVGLKGGEDLLRLTGADAQGYTSLMKLFPPDKNGKPHFVLQDGYKAAFSKKPAERSHYDKEVISINDRVQVFNAVLSGQYIRIIPEKNDPNHTWNSWLNTSFEPHHEAQKMIAQYLLSVLDAGKDNNWSRADAELLKLSEYQQEWGKNILPQPMKVKTEVFMNQLDLFFRLLIFYTLVGGLLLILSFFQLFKPKKALRALIKTIILLGIAGYALHFLGLVGRWYVSGHAPWSNGYEAVIFISWVGITAGLWFYRNGNALIPAAGFLVAVIMMGFAHGGSQLDPQITPLVPVLKSYWLIVHVAVITSSYGFFALSMIIAVISLIFYSVSNQRSFRKHSQSLQELSIVSEMSLTIGLFALTTGNFLGGIWANESWGRYWSWDPKETWAFISIIVYAFVLHMRLVPGLQSKHSFHLATMFAFCSMVMTYFGVNYYLSGLHSYAKGDPLPVPSWVYIGLSAMLALGFFSRLKYKRLTA